MKPGPKPIPARIRFMRHVRKYRGSSCWIWIGGHSGKGYGRFKFMGRMVQATHWSYEYFVGEIPVGMELDHTCRNPRCVNPRHLEPVVHKENLERAPTQVSTLNAKKTHCPRGHPYTRRNANGRRMCGVCYGGGQPLSQS